MDLETARALLSLLTLILLCYILFCCKWKVGVIVTYIVCWLTFLGTPIISTFISVEAADRLRLMADFIRFATYTGVLITYNTLHPERGGDKKPKGDT